MHLLHGLGESRQEGVRMSYTCVAAMQHYSCAFLKGYKDSLKLVLCIPYNKMIHRQEGGVVIMRKVLSYTCVAAVQHYSCVV